MAIGRLVLRHFKRTALKVKVLFQRFFAFGTDVAVVTMLAYAALDGVRLVYPAYGYHSLWRPFDVFVVDWLLVIFFKLPLVELMLLSLLYVVVSTRLIGGTLGMWVWDLRMQCCDGTRPSVLQIAARHIVSFVSVLAFGLGYLWAIIDSKGRTWHDIASGVIVIDPDDVPR